MGRVEGSADWDRVMDRDDEETTFDMEGHLALVPNTSYPMMVLGRQGGRGTGLSEHWQCLRLLG